MKLTVSRRREMITIKFMGKEMEYGMMERGVGYDILRLEAWEDLNGIMVV